MTKSIREPDRRKTMREIKRIGTERIDEYMEIYFNSYPAYKTLDDECRAYYRDKTIRDMERGRDVEFFGCFEDGILAATMKIVDFDINLFGEMRKTKGLMALGVHPLYKKRKIALDMVNYFEDYTTDSGYAMAVLLPFNMKFYHDMGYGYGSKMDEYRVPTTSLPKAESLDGLRFLTGDEKGEVLACFRRFVEAGHGQLMKFSEEIEAMNADEVTKYIGCFDGDRLAGYLAYRFENASDVNYTLNRIVVDEMIYESGAVLKKLLGFLRLQADQVQTVVLRTGAPDFYHVLEDSADISGNYIPFGYLQTNVSAVGVMQKIIDPDRFLEQTAHRKIPACRGRLTAEFAYKYELVSGMNWITIAFEDGGWKIDDSGKRADIQISLRLRDLSSILMGSMRVGSAARLGIAQVTKGADRLTELDSYLTPEQRPFGNSDF